MAAPALWLAAFLGRSALTPSVSIHTLAVVGYHHYTGTWVRGAGRGGSQRMGRHAEHAGSSKAEQPPSRLLAHSPPHPTLASNACACVQNRASDNDTMDTPVPFQVGVKAAICDNAPLAWGGR